MGDENLYLIATNEVDECQQDEALWSKAMALCEGDNSKAKYKYIALRVEMLGAETLSATSVEAHNKPADSEDASEPKQDQLEFVRAQVYAAQNNIPINEVFSDLANGRLTGQKRGNIWYVLTKGYSPDVSVNKEAKTTGNNEETTSLDSLTAPKVSCPRCYAFVPSDRPHCTSCGKPLAPLSVTHQDGTKAPMVSCPRCYAFVPSDRPHCTSCGKPLAPLSVTHQDGTKAPMVSCPRCYAFVPSDRPHCTSCGKFFRSLNATNSVMTNQISDKSNETGFIWWNVWALLNLVLGCLLLVAGLSDVGLGGISLWSLLILGLPLAINTVLMILILMKNKYAFLVATVVSLNPLLWVINGIYLKNRWNHPVLNPTRK